MTYILRAVVKLVAVLGIASVAVFLIAATLNAFQSAVLGEGEVGAMRQATTGAAPSNTVDPEALAGSEHITQPPPRTPLPQLPRSESQYRHSAPESAITEPDPVLSTAHTSKESQPRLNQDVISEDDVNSPLAGRSGPKPTQTSPPPAIRSSEATSEASSPSKTTSAPADTRSYTVKEGDTLYSIARRFYGSGRYWKAIYDANKNLIKDPVKLTLAWKLVLPPQEKVTAGN